MSDSRRAAIGGAQLALRLALPVRCASCADAGVIAVVITLPNGRPFARLDDCPDCAEKRELDPR